MSHTMSQISEPSVATTRTVPPEQSTLRGITSLDPSPMLSSRRLEGITATPSTSGGSGNVHLHDQPRLSADLSEIGAVSPPHVPQSPIDDRIYLAGHAQMNSSGSMLWSGSRPSCGCGRSNFDSSMSGMDESKDELSDLSALDQTPQPTPSVSRRGGRIGSRFGTALSPADNSESDATAVGTTQAAHAVIGTHSRPNIPVAHSRVSSGRRRRSSARGVLDDVDYGVMQGTDDSDDDAMFVIGNLPSRGDGSQYAGGAADSLAAASELSAAASPDLPATASHPARACCDSTAAAALPATGKPNHQSHASDSASGAMSDSKSKSNSPPGPTPTTAPALPLPPGRAYGRGRGIPTRHVPQQQRAALPEARRGDKPSSTDQTRRLGPIPAGPPPAGRAPISIGAMLANAVPGRKLKQHPAGSPIDNRQPYQKQKQDGGVGSGVGGAHHPDASIGTGRSNAGVAVPSPMNGKATPATTDTWCGPHAAPFDGWGPDTDTHTVVAAARAPPPAAAAAAAPAAAAAAGRRGRKPMASPHTPADSDNAARGSRGAGGGSGGTFVVEGSLMASARGPVHAYNGHPTRIQARTARHSPPVGERSSTFGGGPPSMVMSGANGFMSESDGDSSSILMAVGIPGEIMHSDVVSSSRGLSSVFGPDSPSRHSHEASQPLTPYGLHPPQPQAGLQQQAAPGALDTLGVQADCAVSHPDVPVPLLSQNQDKAERHVQDLTRRPPDAITNASDSPHSSSHKASDSPHSSSGSRHAGSSHQGRSEHAAPVNPPGRARLPLVPLPDFQRRPRRGLGTELRHGRATVLPRPATHGDLLTAAGSAVASGEATAAAAAAAGQGMVVRSAQHNAARIFSVGRPTRHHSSDPAASNPLTTAGRASLLAGASPLWMLGAEPSNISPLVAGSSAILQSDVSSMARVTSLPNMQPTEGPATGGAAVSQGDTGSVSLIAAGSGGEGSTMPGAPSSYDRSPLGRDFSPLSAASSLGRGRGSASGSSNKRSGGDKASTAQQTRRMEAAMFFATLAGASVRSVGRGVEAPHSAAMSDAARGSSQLDGGISGSHTIPPPTAAAAAASRLRGGIEQRIAGQVRSAPTLSGQQGPMSDGICLGSGVAAGGMQRAPTAEPHDWVIERSPRS